MLDGVFFSGWGGLLRTALVCVLGYVALLAILRISGKRSHTKMSAFDLVVTVALGSTLSTLIVSRDVALAEGVLALALLVSLQAVIAWGSSRSRLFHGLVRSEPRLLVRNGAVLSGAAGEERITEVELQAAVRASGLPSLEEAAAVILEANGTFSVVPRVSGGGR